MEWPLDDDDDDDDDDARDGTGTATTVVVHLVGHGRAEYARGKARLALGAALTLTREPSNAHDPCAIRVRRADADAEENGGETASHTTPLAWCTPILKDFSRRHSSPALPFQRLTGT